MRTLTEIKSELVELVERAARSWWDVNHRWSRPLILWRSLERNVETDIGPVLFSVKIIQQCPRCGSTRVTPAYYLKTPLEPWHWEIQIHERKITHPVTYHNSPRYKEWKARRKGKPVAADEDESDEPVVSNLTQQEPVKEKEKRCWFCGRTKKDLEEARIIGEPLDDTPADFDTIEPAAGYIIDICPLCKGAITIIAALVCSDQIEELEGRIKNGLDEAVKAVKDYL